MSEYTTNQRQLLLSFFEENPHQPFSALMLAQKLSSNGISQSAIYRNLMRLEKEGHLARVVRQGSREALFRYTKSSHCANTLHLICTNCGEVSHPSPSPAHTLLEQLQNLDGFMLDSTKTVLYGLCRQCTQPTK